MLLLFLLSISSALLFVITTGILVRRYRQHSTSRSSTNNEGVRFVNDGEAFPFLETYNSDLKAVLEGEINTLCLNVPSIGCSYH